MLAVAPDRLRALRKTLRLIAGLLAIVVIIMAVVVVTGASGGRGAKKVAAKTPSTSTRDVSASPAVVGFVGDSNVAMARSSISEAFTNRGDPYVTIELSRVGIGTRQGDFWPDRIKGAHPHPDVWVLNLGANDMTLKGTPDGAGFVDFPAKIDALMTALGDKPVFWTDLPCGREAPFLETSTGCPAINRALQDATRRWKNLRVLNWSSLADGHRDWMISPPHFTRAGYDAWATFVVRALDSRLRH